MKNYNLIIFDVSGTLCGHFGKLYDGIPELIEEIHASGKKIALATNLSRGGLLEFVEMHGLKNKLVSYVSATETAFKPSPEMLELVLLESDEEKENALMVGDTASDVHMAKAAGVDTCAVNWADGNWSHELLSANPEYKAETLKELKKNINL